MATRYYSNTAPPTTLTAGINAITTTITVASAAGLPPFQPFTLALDPNTPTMELVEVTAAAGTTLTVTRAIDGTSASTHGAGAVVMHVSSARDFAEANAHISATTNVHGLAGGAAVVGTTTTQTLTNKTINGPVINDGTITNTAITTNQNATVANLEVNGDLHVDSDVALEASLRVGTFDGSGFTGSAEVNGDLHVAGGASVSTNSNASPTFDVQKNVGQTSNLQEWSFGGSVLASVNSFGEFSSQSADVAAASLVTAAAGWSVAAPTIGVVKNGMITINGNFQRTGANITTDAVGALSTGIIQMGTVSVGYRPKTGIGTLQFHCSNSLGTGSSRIGSAGAGIVELVRWQASSTISTGNVVGFTLTYPLS